MCYCEYVQCCCEIMDSSSSAGSLSDYFKIILSGIAIASPILWQVRKFRIQQRDIEIQRINDFKEINHY